jgi:membrane-associated protease RseP (regulator of RpoE activity)
VDAFLAREIPFLGIPRTIEEVKIGDTDYCISATPLGGYVKMTGESMPGENLS